MSSPGRPLVEWAFGFAAGVTVVVFVCAAVFGFGGKVWLHKQDADLHRGWPMVPVVVAAVDLPAGATLTFDQISQRPVPEVMATSSVVKPDSASYVVNQVLNAPVAAGEPLRWSGFVISGEKPWHCSTEEERACEPLAPKIHEKTNDDIRTRLGVPR